MLDFALLSLLSAVYFLKIFQWWAKYPNGPALRTNTPRIQTEYTNRIYFWFRLKGELFLLLWKPHIIDPCSITDLNLTFPCLQNVWQIILQSHLQEIFLPAADHLVLLSKYNWH